MVLKAYLCPYFFHAVIKWFAAIVGYLIFRLPGAVIGFLLGSLVDNMGGRNQTLFGDIYRQQVSPADFELHLLTLCSIIIKADGQVNQKELDYVRRYFLSTYGKERANAIFRTFNEVIKKREISAQRICQILVQRTRYEVRLQLLHFLFSIANSDGVLSEAEIRKLSQLAGYLRIRAYDYDSIRAMFVKSADNAYKILEIEKSASDDEVKKAYRRMAKRYHPDKVVTENEAIKKGAEEKFKQVQKAYEQIQKERGI